MGMEFTLVLVVRMLDHADRSLSTDQNIIGVHVCEDNVIAL